MSAGAMATAVGPWGTVLSDTEKNTLNADAKKDLERRGARSSRQDPMMAICFKQLAKLQSVSASKPLGKKIEDRPRSSVT
eukprot:4274175-Prymnesium_polylepis.1